MLYMAQAIRGSNSQVRGQVHPSGPALPSEGPTPGTMGPSTVPEEALAHLEALQG